ncbi:hypothetical protein XENTR_v10001542 [Xenopus tropicalis]|nr:hypothetical protein XENTR_v10001542 [Xenopus tropicalis]KAE8632419.1 hypothetical protein XENTR_v10001542 [Xenopus tropicalis]KAE8632420.1 hypothetical protein XENTR_v10001542 [Xenopus tropicalis]
MDTSEPLEEGDRTHEQRPHTRSNPEGAEDREGLPQAGVGSRSEGEGEAAQVDDPLPTTTAVPTNCTPPPTLEFQLKTPRVNCPEKVIICLDLSEEMSTQKLESFNGSKANALNSSQKMIEMFVRTKHKIDKRHEFALVVANNEAMWLSGFTSDPREVCSCLYDLETNVCESFNLEGLFNLIQQRTEFPVTDNVQTIPPPYVVRIILIYSRPASQPALNLTDNMKVNRKLHLAPRVKAVGRNKDENKRENYSLIEQCAVFLLQECHVLDSNCGGVRYRDIELAH